MLDASRDAARPSPHARVPGTMANRFDALWRMRSYIRPYRGQMALMFGCAALGVGASIFIPLITMAIVDGPIIGRSCHVGRNAVVKGQAVLGDKTMLTDYTTA